MQRIVLCGLVVLAMAGCGSESETTGPDIATGTVVIDAEPDHLSAPWTITGPGGYASSDRGDATLGEMAVGTYTITWRNVPDWGSPEPQTLPLLEGEVCSFVGQYRDTGRLVVDPHPHSLAARWTLTVADGLEIDGQGRQTVDEVPRGAYLLTWQDHAGWTTPAPVAGTMQAGVDDVVTSLYLNLAAIPSGVFAMGSPQDEPGRQGDEILRTVTLSRSLEVQTREVTNEQFLHLVGWALEQGYCSLSSTQITDGLGSHGEALVNLELTGQALLVVGDELAIQEGRELQPVVGVTWFGAATYANWLSLYHGLPPAYDQESWQPAGGDIHAATGFRLPTEAEWEYACRAGGSLAFGTLAITDLACDDVGLSQLGWYCGNADGQLHDVGLLAANDWSLTDTHGNAMEWCHDVYASYTPGNVVDPVNDSGGVTRVLRGGYSSSQARHCRAAARHELSAQMTSAAIGFRVVRTAP